MDKQWNGSKAQIDAWAATAADHDKSLARIAERNKSPRYQMDQQRMDRWADSYQRAIYRSGSNR